MRYIITILIFIFCCNCLSILHAQDLDNPGDYISAVNSAQSEMNATYMAYLSAVAHSGRARKIEKMRQQTIESITNCKYKIVDLPIYKGDNSLRQSSIAYVDLCYKVFNEDYAHIVNMEDIIEQSYNEMEEYLLLQEKTNEKIDTASTKEELAIKTFAAKYKVTLVNTSNDLEDKLDIAGKLTQYHDRVYLIFFKCNWEDGQLTDAFNKKNITNIEQARTTLISYATEGLAGLDTLHSFNGDITLYEACKQALLFYKNAAQNDMPKLTNFFLAEENFEKIKAAFEKKPDDSKTQANIDAYNKAVNDMNAASNTFNQTNDNINNKRTQVVDNWNNTDKAFEDSNMPHYK